MNLDTFEQYKDDRLSFVAVIGCGTFREKEGTIDVSEQPIMIVNGIQYFLLRTQSYTTEMLKILYSICETMYISQRILPQFQTQLCKNGEITEHWQIKNYLCIVTKQMHEMQSLVKTSADSKSFASSIQYNSDYVKQRKVKSFYISQCLEKLFSRVSFVNQTSVSQYDVSVLKEQIQMRYDQESSRWFVYDSILKCFSKLTNGFKGVYLRQFHKINQETIIGEIERKTYKNLSIFCAQMLRSCQGKKILRQDKQKQLQKEKIRQRQKMRKVLNSILEPFRETEQSWLGNIESFKIRQSKIKQEIENRVQQIMEVGRIREQQILEQQIQNIVSTENNFQIFGNPRLDNLTISFSLFFQKARDEVEKIVQFNLNNKKEVWKIKSKGRMVKNRNDYLSDLQTRIELNANKKKGLQHSLDLAEKEYEYFNNLKYFTMPKNQRQCKNA